MPRSRFFDWIIIIMGVVGFGTPIVYVFWNFFLHAPDRPEMPAACVVDVEKGDDSNATPDDETSGLDTETEEVETDIKDRCVLVSRSLGDERERHLRALEELTERREDLHERQELEQLRGERDDLLERRQELMELRGLREEVEELEESVGSNATESDE